MNAPLSLRRTVSIALAACALTAAAAQRLQFEPIDPNKLSDAQRQRASELFQQLKSTPDDHAKRTAIVKEIAAVGRGAAQKMFDILDRQWAPKWSEYQGQFSAAAREAAKAKSTAQARAEIGRLEAQVRGLRNKGDLSKGDIQRVGDPALARLAELKVLTVAEVLAADPELAPVREEILAIAVQRDACIAELFLLEDEAKPFGEADVKVFEGQASALALGPPAEHLAILAANERLKGQLPDAELAAIRDMNRYRTLIGLAPCAIDVKLCEASRGHSEDMGTRGFFAHDSPVPGKETPWKRAALAGTSANAENIYGGGNGIAANKAWWYSPGHHKNMLSPGARRVGMGGAKGRWTQMFGG